MTFMGWLDLNLELAQRLGEGLAEELFEPALLQAGGVGVFEGVVVDVAVAVERLRVERVRDGRIRGDPPAQLGVVVAGSEVVEPGGGIQRLAGAEGG